MFLGNGLDSVPERRGSEWVVNRISHIAGPHRIRGQANESTTLIDKKGCLVWIQRKVQ
jgi:hypothetical protein